MSNESIERYDLLMEFRRIVAGDCIERDIARHQEVVTAIERALADHERIVKELEARLFKNVCRIHTEWTIDRYLMSNAINRLDPAEKATRHIEICQFYVAAVRGCSREDAMSNYESDFDHLHEESQELTNSLNTEIGFPLDQTPELRRSKSEIL